MNLQWMLLVLIAAGTGQATPEAGSISGVVVNASREGAAVGGAEVVLRVMIDGQFVVAAEGIADEQGRFMFDDIPVDADYIYLPGANHDGIHYPSSRVRLSPQLPHARLQLAIHETVTDPNPLVLRHHHVTIHSEADAIRVTEKLFIENPSLTTYIGRADQEGGRATTMRLAIPSNFRRVTFEKEFYGRQFTLFEERLVTDIPWTPGPRELELTYVLPNDGRTQAWERPLDLPCDQLRIEVHSDTPNEIACNLELPSSQKDGVIIFETVGQSLSADQVVRIQLERPLFSLATHGRWLALAVLVGLMTSTVLIRLQVGRRNRSARDGRQTDIASAQAA